MQGVAWEAPDSVALGQYVASGTTTWRGSGSPGPELRRVVAWQAMVRRPMRESVAWQATHWAGARTARGRVLLSGTQNFNGCSELSDRMLVTPQRLATIHHEQGRRRGIRIVEVAGHDVRVEVRQRIAQQHHVELRGPVHSLNRPGDKAELGRE